MTHVEVVAEIGTNWDPNDRERTITEAVCQAKEAGADYVKFQDWAPIEQMNRPQEWKDRCRPWTLTREDRCIIAEASRVYSIPWFCSVFTEEAAYFAYDNDCPYIKIASSEAANDKLLRGLIGFDVIVSFGEVKDWDRLMLTLATVNAHSTVIPMGCIAEYPVKMLAGNLIENGGWSWTVMQEGHKLGLRTGWSSHIEARYAPAHAAMLVKRLGVTMVEAHMRFEGLPESCPDNGPWSLYPAEFKQLVAAVREAESA